MSGHRRSRRRSPNASSSRRTNYSLYHTSTSTSTRDHEERDAHSHPRRRPKRSLSLGSRPGWVILSQRGFRRDGFRSDRISSAISLTSNGDEVSVSLELVEPPGISVVSLDWPNGRGASSSACPEVIAAHRGVVLLQMPSSSDPRLAADRLLADYFVYQASSDTSRRPSLLLLLPADEEIYWVERVMRRDDTGVMSMPCTSQDDPSFVVAKLAIIADSPPVINAHLFRSGSGEWKVFRNLHVHGANGGRDLEWWCTNAVVPYRRRFLIWVDYYRGMILADMSSSESEKKDAAAAPRLRYVPLPVDKVSGNPEHIDYGRGFPEGSRCVCATRDGIKFVSVDHKHTSNWGVGHQEMLTWSHTFRITTWSLREDDYSWRRDATMYEEELWDALDSEDQLFPHVAPEFPVVNMENPDAVCFRLRKNRNSSYGEPTWMIEVDMKKKVLLAATAYSMEETSSYGDAAGTINYARVASEAVPFSSDLPRYLDGGQEDCKKRRQ